MEEHARSIEELGRELERLRTDVEGTVKRPRASATAPMSRARARPLPKDPGGPVAKDATVPQAGSGPVGIALSPEGMSTEDPASTEQAIAGLPTPPSGSPPSPGGPAGEAPPAGPGVVPSSETGTQETPAASPSPPVADEEWRREAMQDRAVARASGVPQSTEYVAALEGVATGDCKRAMRRLRAIASKAEGSPVSDNALYWEARCRGARGDQAGAVSKLGDIVARYPKSDKAPAALWEQGKLLLRKGDTAGARVALSKLIREYPSSTEAAQARRKLAAIGN